MRNNVTELVFILDRSGSMAGLESDVVGGFNATLQRQKEEEGSLLVSTVLFDNRSFVLHDRVAGEKIPPTINFAPMAKCPAYFNGGLIDPVSPAYSTYAAYLRWGGGDKTFVAVPGHGHDWWAAFDRAAYRWLDRVFKKSGKIGPVFPK